MNIETAELRALQHDNRRDYGYQNFDFHTGRSLARLLGYAPDWLKYLPAEAVEAFAGTGNPFSLGEIRSGEYVVDIGCGAGFDSLIAAHKVGANGAVIGVDMTPAVLHTARHALGKTGLTNIEFREGKGEWLPVPTDWADVIISNGVLNLLPDKRRVFQEMERVLKPDGRLQIADIMVQTSLAVIQQQPVDLWTGSVTGALLETELEAMVISAGFVDFEITWHDDAFTGAAHADSVASFGIVGVNYRARKPENDAEWLDAMAALDLPVVSALTHSG